MNYTDLRQIVQGHRSCCQSKVHKLCNFLLVICNFVCVSLTVFDIWTQNWLVFPPHPCLTAPSGWKPWDINYQRNLCTAKKYI